MTNTTPPGPTPPYVPPPGSGYPPGGWGPGPTRPGWGGGPPYPPYVPGAWVPPSPSRARGEWPSVRELWGRVPGCLNIAVLFIPGAIPLLMLYAMVRSARHRARTVFGSLHNSFADTTLARVKGSRTVLAGLASTVFLFAYGARQDYENAFMGGALRLIVAPWLLAVTGPLVIYLLMRWATAGERGRMRASLRGPLTALAKYVGALTAFPVLALVASWGVNSAESTPALSLTLALLSVMALIWALLFAAFASGLVIRSGFGVGRIHQALPALLTALLVWEFVPAAAVLSGMPPGPPALSLLFMFGGPLSVTAMAWWEIHLLTTRHGVVLRA